MSDELLDGFRVGEFDVYPREEKMVAGEVSHHLEPKVMQVLVTLARRQGRPVSRAEILKEVWSDVVVGDEVLSRAISLLRGYLGDERTQPRFIRTLPRYGYELIAEIGGIPRATNPPRRRSRMPMMLGSIGATCVVLAAIYLLVVAKRASEEITLAVLPLSIGSDEAGLAYLGGGIADHLLNELGRIGSVTVVARRSSFAIRDTDENVRAIGEQLNARYLIEGSLGVQGQEMLLTMYLVDSETGTNLWTTEIRVPEDRLFELQRRAGLELLDAISSRLRLSVRSAEPKAVAVGEDAYRRFLEARYQWQLRGERRISRAIELLGESIALEPSFAAAHLALAQSLALRPFYADEPLAEQFALARRSADQALGLDPGLAVEVAALEGFMQMGEWRWAEAQQTLQGAVEQDPTNVNAQYWYSLFLSQTGHYQEALEHIQRAQALDPVSAVLNDRLALANLWVDDLPAAASRYAIAKDLGYTETTQPLSLILFLYRSGQFDDIESLLLRMGERADWVHPFVLGLREPGMRQAGIAVVEASREAGTVPPELLFGIWLLLGDPDRAFRDFIADPKTPYIEVFWARECAPLRADPRFADLLARVGMKDTPERF